MKDEQQEAVTVCEGATKKGKSQNQSKAKASAQAVAT